MWTLCQTTVLVVYETFWTLLFHVILVTNNQQESTVCDKWQLPSHISLFLNGSTLSTVFLLCSVILTSRLRCSTQTKGNEFLPEVISGPLPPSTHRSLWATTQRSPEFFYSVSNKPWRKSYCGPESCLFFRNRNGTRMLILCQSGLFFCKWGRICQHLCLWCKLFLRAFQVSRRFRKGRQKTPFDQHMIELLVWGVKLLLEALEI